MGHLERPREHDVKPRDGGASRRRARSGRSNRKIRPKNVTGSWTLPVTSEQISRVINVIIKEPFE